MEITKKDWEEVIEQCLKQFELMQKTLKNITMAAKLEGVMFEKSMEELKKLPKEEEKDTGAISA